MFRRRCFLAGLGLLALLLASGPGVASPAEAGPTVVFEAKDVAGVAHPAAEPGAKASLWVFIVHDCPISNTYAPEIARIAAEYAARGVAVRIVYAETDYSPVALREHAAAHGYTGLLFEDGALRMAKACGVSVVPSVAVIDPAGRAVYRGRIDDRFVQIGRERAAANRRDLREALEEVLAGRPVSVAQTPAVGCAIGLE